MANELKASLTIDVTPFLNGIRSAASQGQGIISKIFSGAGAPKVDVDTAPAVEHLKNLETQSEKTGGILGNIGKIAAGFGLAAVAVGVAKVGSAMVSGNAEMETYKTQLGTLLGGADKAQERLAELAKFGAETPFDLPELVKAEKVLIGFGLQGEKAMKLTGQSATQLRTTIGDISAGVGVPFEELAVTFGKFSAGATGEAISRLQELGIVTKEQLTNVGIQFDKAGALVSPLPEAMQAAVKIAGEKFGGGMDALSKTFSGRVSTLKDTITQGLNFVGAPLFEGLGKGLETLNTALSSPAFTESLGKFGEAFSAMIVPIMQILPQLITGVIDLIAPLATALGPVLTTIGEAMGPLIQQLAGLAGPLAALVAPLAGILATALKALAPIIGTVINFAVRFVQILGTVFDKLAGPINEVITMMGGVLGELVNDVLDALLEVLDAIGPLLPVIVDLFVSLLKALLPMTTSVLPLFNAALKLVAFLLEKLAPIVGAVAKVIGGLADVLGVVTGAIGSVISGIGGFFSDLVGGLDETDKRLAGIEKRAADAQALQVKRQTEANVDKFQGIVDGLVKEIEAGKRTNESAQQALNNIFANAERTGTKLLVDDKERLAAIHRLADARKALDTPTPTPTGAGAPDPEAEKKAKAAAEKRRKEEEEREKRHAKLMAEIAKARSDNAVAAIDDEVRRSLEAYDLKRSREFEGLQKEYGEFKEFADLKAQFDIESTRDRTALEAKLRKDAADKRLAEQQKEDRAYIDALKAQQSAIVGETAAAMRARLEIQKEIAVEERRLLATPAEQDTFDAQQTAEVAKAESAIRLQVKREAIAQESDLDLQAHQLKLLEIETRLQAELDANKLNEAAKIEAMKTANAERLAEEQAYLKKTNVLVKGAYAVRDAITRQFVGDPAKKAELEAEKKKLAEEVRALDESHAAKKISDEQYRRQRASLDAKMTALANEQEGQRFRVVQFFNEAASKFLERELVSRQKTYEASLQKFAEGAATFGDVLVDSVGVLGATIGKAAVDQQNVAHAALKAVGALAFDFVQKMIPIWTASFLGPALATPQSIITGGGAALAEWAALTIVLEGIVAGARGILGLRHGIDYVPGNPAHGDVVPAMLTPSEMVLSPEQAALWRPIIKGGLPMPDMGRIAAMLTPVHSTAVAAHRTATEAVAAVAVMGPKLDIVVDQLADTNGKLKRIADHSKATADSNQRMADEPRPRGRTFLG